MPRSRKVLLAISAVLLPVVLATAGWLIVSNVLASADSIPLPVRPSLSASPQPEPTESGDDHGGSRGPGSGAAPSSGAAPTGGSGRCSEAEHRNDPSCLGSASPSPQGSGDSGSDSSGKGSGSDDGSGSGSGKSGGGGDDD